MACDSFEAPGLGISLRPRLALVRAQRPEGNSNESRISFQTIKLTTILPLALRRIVILMVTVLHFWKCAGNGTLAEL